MKKRLESCALAVVGTILTTLVLFSGAVVPAVAEPTTVEQARKALDAIEAEASAVDAKYDTLHVRLDDTQKRIEQAKLDYSKQSEKLAELRAQVAQYALADWRNHGLDTTTALITTDDVEAFLSQLSTVQQVTYNTNALISDFELAQSNLDDIRRSAEADERALADDRAEMDKLKAAADKKVQEAKALLNRLTADQRAQLRAGRSAARSDSQRPAFAAGGGNASARAMQAVAYAEAQVGKAYVMGGTGPNAYDCSGLTEMAYRSAGVSIPRTSQDQYRVGQRVSLSDLRPGDLVFYYSGISHVAIYVGGGKIVHAANPYTGVVYDSVTLMPFMGARRVA